MTLTQENIQTAIDSLLALDTLRVAGVIPENSFDAILYGASGMPSESEILVARDALLAMKGLQVNGNFPEIVELALYKIIAESGGGGTGAVSSVNGETGDVVLTASDVSAEPAFTSLSDSKIGNRTASDATAPGGLGPGTLTDWLGWIVNRIKAIVGEASWFTAPATNLNTAAAHIANTSNPHATTPAQVFSATQAINLAWASPASGGAGVPSFRALVANDLPLASSTTRGAISRENNSSFTPIVLGSVTPGTPTYASQSGSYIRVGKLCLFTVNISLSNLGGMAGNILIGSLPFTANPAYYGVSIANYTGVTFSTNYTQMSGRVEASTDTLTLYQNGSAQSVVALQNTNLASNFSVVVSGCYITA